MDELGFEPKASSLQGKRSTIELQAHKKLRYPDLNRDSSGHEPDGIPNYHHTVFILKANEGTCTLDLMVTNQLLCY